MIVTGEKVIFKNDKGTYHIIVKNTELQEDGTKKDIFMNFSCKFKKGIDVKNKTKINIKNSFISFFRTQEDGKIKKIPQLIITDFDVLEEGIDQNMKSFETKQREKENKENNNEFFYSGSDELPF